MSRSLFFQFALLLSLVFLSPCQLVGQEEIAADQLAFFEKKIRPGTDCSLLSMSLPGFEVAQGWFST